MEEVKKPSLSSKLIDSALSMATFGLLTPKKDEQKFKTAEEALGQIFRLMQELENDRKLEREEENFQLRQQEDINERHNRELIKALTGRRKPKPKKKKEKKAEPAKKEEKPGEKKVEPAKKEEVPPTKPEVGPTAKPVEAPATKAPPEVVKPAEIPKPKKAEIPKVESKPSILPKVAVGAAAAAGLLMPSETVAAVIDKASNMVGVDKSLMYAIAKQESGFNPSAAAKTSSARGLYQFIKSTWEQMGKVYGNKFPILREKGPEDPEANAIAGALYIKENSAILSKAGIPIDATSIYASHFLGPGGARKLFSSDKNEDASKLLPSAAQANKFIFYKKDNTPRTTQEVIDVLYEKVGKYQSKYQEALNARKVTALNSNSNFNNLTDENQNLNLSADINPQQRKITVNNNSFVNSEKSETIQQNPYDDRPAMLRKK